MATSGRSAGGADDKPTFTFEQIVLRFVVGVLVIALFVMIVELGQVRGRVGSLETAGAPAPAAATGDPLGSPQSFKVVLKEMAVVPDVVEVPAGTPVTLNVVNEGAIPHNLAIGGGPKTPDLKPFGTATLDLGTVTKPLTGECSVPATRRPAWSSRCASAAPLPRRPRRPGTPTPPWTTAPSSTPTPPHRPRGRPTTPGSPPPPAAASTS